ncbi:MAG: tyrosine-type recombinase/integrase, partial [Anaerovibrio sp.]|nr:tyrosine-type recombinase/integrase [Anaerovibrio sp.]
SFRHTQATRLASAGVLPVTVARRLGHSRVDTTLNIYTHDTSEQQKSVADVLQDMDEDAFWDE